METKMTILIIEEEKAEMSNYMHKFFDSLPCDYKKKKDEKLVEFKFKFEELFYEVRFIELSLKEKKLQYFVQESISIILVFNLEDRTSFENLGNKMIQLKKIYKFENYLFILGSSPNNDESNNIDNKEEIKCLMQTCELKGKYEEISQYNQDKINCFFNSVLISSIESLKSKKKSDKSSINTSCIIF